MIRLFITVLHFNNFARKKIYTGFRPTTLMFRPRPTQVVCALSRISKRRTQKSAEFNFPYKLEMNFYNKRIRGRSS